MPIYDWPNLGLASRRVLRVRQALNMKEYIEYTNQIQPASWKNNNLCGI